MVETPKGEKYNNNKKKKTTAQDPIHISIFPDIPLSAKKIQPYFQKEFNMKESADTTLKAPVLGKRTKFI